MISEHDVLDASMEGFQVMEGLKKSKRRIIPRRTNRYTILTLKTNEDSLNYDAFRQSAQY